MHLVAIETVTGAEAIDLTLRVPLLSLEPRKLGLSLRERTEVFGDEHAYGTATLRGAYPCRTVDIIRD